MIWIKSWFELKLNLSENEFKGEENRFDSNESVAIVDDQTAIRRGNKMTIQWIIWKLKCYLIWIKW